MKRHPHDPFPPHHPFWTSNSPARRCTLLAMLSTLFATSCGAPKPPPSQPQPERAKISKISEQPGSVRLDGLGPILGFARGRDCTFIHCLELVLEGLGRPMSYDDLMGASGMAFRTQFRIDRWDVGNPDPLVGESALDPLFDAVGWEYDAKVVRRDELSEAAALRGQITQSIDASVPVLAANIIRPEDWGIIVGYRADQQWVCRSYNGGALASDRLANGWPTAVVFLTKRKAPPARRDSLMNSVRRAIDLFQRRQAGPYTLGSRAFDTWCQNLRSAGDRSYIHPNVWTYICLIDARSAAVRYLRAIAPEFGPPGKSLLKAAELYEQEVALLNEGYRFVPAERAFPDSMPPQEMRERQIEVLQRAKSLEEQAVSELEKAL